MGLMLLGEANGEAPAQAELHLPAPGLPRASVQRVEWAFASTYTNIGRLGPIDR
jgi:hypothetical protein